MSASIQELAGEAARCFETAKRDSGAEFVRVRDGSPEWVTELVRVAHGLDADGAPGWMLPDDWRYRKAAEALEHIAEAADPEDARWDFADAAVDVYTAARFEWLGSDLRRASYVDEAVEELGPPDPDGIVERIAVGQYAEAAEVYELVFGALEERRDELDAAELFGEVVEEVTNGG